MLVPAGDEACHNQAINFISIMNSPGRSQQEPPASPKQPRNELKRVELDIATARNRLATLRLQLQRQKDAITKHRMLTEQVLAKKVAVNAINSYKMKDDSNEIARLEQLRNRNLQMRVQHQREIESIQKAIYLVKLDDARQVKNISEEHRRKIREIESHSLSQKAEKKKVVREEAEKAKQRQLQYWKQKLSLIYAEQALSEQELTRAKDEKAKQLKQLEQEEIKLLEEINLYHNKCIETKKQYVAALSLPAKDVAQAMGSTDETAQSPRKAVGYARSRSLMEIDPKAGDKSKMMAAGRAEQNGSLPIFGPRLKVPHANVNEAKLKIILQELKKIDRRRSRHEQQQHRQANNSSTILQQPTA